MNEFLGVLDMPFITFLKNAKQINIIVYAELTDI
jgi:hypothetical protein